ncbi:MAG: 30S ribosomal protein S13 [Candidatus Omnitrophica bacterium]|nr:30S ribosomal protein S13 [Candidatus Omnitrophota bacterium]MBU2044571.1 30S ribosomal protein S13 [Candidatus Omnitrophota bacterium]MBU2251092.1 30S ribosomal protein S13 [Candidatus Omnitrophota bacterium]MBU2265857.1 30S ribosomal protein S13 [Candidatus Omnitrophota bacterium]MBU2474187.1 30S ribosomal protein S13 [Candidatus Omnitrophota bacterium]
MPRIFGVDIPKNKKIKISLRYVYGIGPVRALEILNKVKIDPEKRASELSDEEISQIATYVQANYRIEGELRREIAQNIRRLIDINSYRGSRHKKGLPVRGQRTKCNARTRKGPRPRVGGIKA